MPDDDQVDLVEVRLLGPLRVRDAQGQPVPPRSWRTGKIADLLRVLALRSGEPVSVDLLLDLLWSDVGEERGRASLRTAASQVRGALGRDSVERKFDSLILRHAWVDVVAFRTLAQDARRDFLTGRLASSVARAREAEALYLDDLHFNTVESDWATRERDALRAAHHQLIADAAAASLDLGWLRDGLEFASRSLAHDPFSERAHRSLMRAYAGLGEVDRALRVFADCQRVLADELGADPSAETQDVHLRILRGEPVVPRRSPPFVGRLTEVRWLTETLESLPKSGQPGLVVVSGEHGSGRTTLVERVLDEVSSDVVRLSASPASDVADGLVERWFASTLDQSDTVEASTPRDNARAAKPLVLVLDDLHAAGAAAVEACDRFLARLSGPVVLLATVESGQPAALALPGALVEASRRQLRRLRLGPLLAEEVAQLAGDLLGEEPQTELVDALVGASEGRPVRVVELLHHWQSSGRLTVTSQGLALLPEGSPTRPHGAATAVLGRVLNQLAAGQEDLLQLCAVLGEPVTSQALSLVVDTVDQHTASVVLDRLHDLGVLSLRRAAYRFRDPLLRDAVLAWARPSSRRHLHRLVAERAPITSERRIRHWLQAGEPELACAAAMEATREALAEGRYDSAREHLLEVQGLGEIAAAAPQERLEISEQLGDLNAMLGRTYEAAEAYSQALAAARSTDPGDLIRLQQKLAGVDKGEEASREVSTLPLPLALSQSGAVAARLQITGGSPPTAEVENALRAAVAEADDTGSAQERVEARLLLANVVCVPRRRFAEVRRLTDEALAVVGNPLLHAEATMTAHHVLAVLGNAGQSLAPLLGVRDVARASGISEFRAKAELLVCLVRHESGDPDFAESWLNASALAEVGLPDESWRWIGVRAWTERGAYEAALRELDLIWSGPGAGEQAAQLVSLASAQLYQALGDRDHARNLLQDCVDDALRGGRSLLLPEAAARLAALEAHEDPDGAAYLLDLAERSAGETFVGRERCVKLLALAELRFAEGNPAAATDLAAATVSMAESLGLLFQQAEAKVAQAGFLGQAGDRFRQVEVAEEAVKLYVEAGAPAAGDRVHSWLDEGASKVAS